jgi:predicted nucleic acid-binding protein
MILCYLDASAWVKRYTGEPGWDVVDVLLDETVTAGSVQLVSSAINHAELVSAIVRFRNRTSLADSEFDRVLQRIAADEIRLLWLSVSEATSYACTGLIVKHNLNAADAVLLSTLLDLRQQAKEVGIQVRLIASDKRFLRAATAEGLPGLDPEASSLREARELAARWLLKNSIQGASAPRLRAARTPPRSLFSAHS